MKFTHLSAALLGAVCSFQLAAPAAVKLPAVFGDNMVLQQQQAVPVWGWADPKARVTVKFAGQTRSTRADASGKWLVKLAKMPASCMPQALVVESGESITLTNILVGEVWLASGQSNMEKPIGMQRGQQPTLNYEQELAAAIYPQVRIFLVEKELSAKPLDQLLKFQGWQECSSNSLNTMHFSAAAYFFGRELHTNLNVPIGLIESSWGGTRVEPWTPPVGFQSVPSLAKVTTPAFGTNKIPNTAPTVLYNAMIAPIAGFGMRGAIWYQGESNRSDTNYDAKMAALVGGWRQVWHEGPFPFYFVQIAPFKYIKDLTTYSAETDPLPPFWLSQSRAARHIANAGMIVTTDLVDDLSDIHPRNKKEVGHRLALLALDKTYEQPVPSTGPAFKQMVVIGNKAFLSFKHLHGGLVSQDGQPLTWFTIAGADRKFVPAEAKIVGDNVVVSAAGVECPKAVRFAWNQIAQPNLVNAAGLPAEPFSTDHPVN
ncbi:MAG: sialate O-acetylesterase [Verrucomicrobiota bacterium]